MTQTNAQAALAAAALRYSGMSGISDRDVQNTAATFLKTLENWSPTLADAQPSFQPVQDSPDWGSR